mmetsp:Transcript_38603/g.73980  ORF Transcript_38603/g.73980 Transcript_38603/m.73980 type:complete len:300 (-) Transcript_38603:230-1129(-)
MPNEFAVSQHPLAASHWPHAEQMAMTSATMASVGWMSFSWHSRSSVLATSASRVALHTWATVSRTKALGATPCSSMRLNSAMGVRGSRALVAARITAPYTSVSGTMPLPCICSKACSASLPRPHFPSKPMSVLYVMTSGSARMRGMHCTTSSASSHSRHLATSRTSWFITSVSACPSHHCNWSRAWWRSPARMACARASRRATATSCTSWRATRTSPSNPERAAGALMRNGLTLLRSCVKRFHGHETLAPGRTGYKVWLDVGEKYLRPRHRCRRVGFPASTNATMASFVRGWLEPTSPK